MSFECIKSVKEKFFTNYGDSVTNRDSTYAQLPDGFKLDAERFVCEMNKAIKTCDGYTFDMRVEADENGYWLERNNIDNNIILDAVLLSEARRIVLKK
jgi:hypothetical protein